MLPGDCLKLDFTDIETCDVSFVDEIVLEVQIYLREKKENILLFLAHFNQDIIDNLEGAIARREGKGVKIPILVQENDRLSCIGSLEPALAETLDFMRSRNEINARDIAEHTGTAINAASNRLKKLYDLRLCLREERVDINGKQHIYRIPV